MNKKQIINIITLNLLCLINLNGQPFVDINAKLAQLQGSSSVWGDLDKDGDLDLVLTGNNKGAKTIIYRNDGNVFTKANDKLIGITSGWVELGDYENDGDLDILICGNPGEGSTFTSGQGITKIYRNDNNHFVDIYAELIGVDNSICKWIDYDNDNDLDVFICGLSSPNPEWNQISRVCQ